MNNTIKNILKIKIERYILYNKTIKYQKSKFLNGHYKKFRKVQLVIKNFERVQIFIKKTITEIDKILSLEHICTLNEK